MKITHTKLAIGLSTVIAIVAGIAQSQSDSPTSSLSDQQASSQRHSRAPRSRPSNPFPIVPKSPTDFGDPIAGLTATQLADFAAGLEQFQSVDTPESGLGPIFNNNSCVACHSAPIPGSASTITETRFGRFANGVFDPLVELGGSLLQSKAIAPACQEVIPSQANVTALRLTTPLFGAGLIEAIPDSEIMQGAAANRSDGVGGRASIVQDIATGETRVGRFGWKAQHALLVSFAGDAYVNEIGITNRLFPQENAPNGNAALLAQCDLTADPEDTTDPATGKADIDRFADFMRMLAPPPVVALTSTAKAGAEVFVQTGCHACHQSTMVTGESTIAALDHKVVPLFSDLLLHDMGSLGDGIAQGTATPREMRTAPLWGLRARTVFLHDGRAATVDSAIRQHDGEAARARDRYVRSSPTLQAQLLQFLGSI